MATIDLNADVGEGFDDEGVMRFVTSVNVACGYHAGDRKSMRRVCAAALERGIAIGAHVSYRDRDGFGRRELDVGPHTILLDVADQVGRLRAASGGAVSYVKPHGALYHRASTDPEAAAAIVDASTPLALLAFPRSALLAHARDRGLAAVAEGFADRGYASDGTLLPRDRPGALLAPDDAAAQAVELAWTGGLGSICVHSDTDDAGAVAAAVRAALEDAGFDLRPFA
jgi:UPF0271 protein